VALDPADAMAHLVLGFALITTVDAFAALEAARRAVEPSLAWAVSFYGYLLAMTGQPPEDAIAHAQHAMRLSPRDAAEWQFYDALAPSRSGPGRRSPGRCRPSAQSRPT
jgi:hypothetical protein